MLLDPECVALRARAFLAIIVFDAESANICQLFRNISLNRI